MTFLTYRSNRQSIREKEIEYAKKGKDTTIDSLNEAKEIVKQLYKNVKKVNKLKKNRKRYTYFIVKAHTSKTKLSNGKYLYIN